MQIIQLFKNDKFIDLFRSVELLRIIFIILAYFGNVIPLIYATDSIQLLTDMNAFCLVLEFDNIINRPLSGKLLSIKLKKS